MSGIPAGAGSLLGKRLGKYEILALLALGGTAEIYLARIGGAAGFEKYVVVKCLHDHLADDQEFVKMFLDEARLAAHLDHSNIVQTMELGEHENRYFMVMEFLAGLSLAMVVRRAGERLAGGRIPVPLVLNMVAQSCAGLHYAHERSINGKVLNIVHRDISPQNLVVSFEGVVKVVDFGIAKAELRETKTRSGTIKGKFAYMSPEQCVAANVDRRTDVFALGVIAHELLTGRRLFKRPSPYETYQAVIDCAVEIPSKLNVELDPAVDAIVMKALAKDKDDRYPTAEAFGDALLGYLHHRGKGSGPGDVSRFFDASFVQEIEEHGARMRELIAGRDFSVDTGVNWDGEEKKDETVDIKKQSPETMSISLATSDMLLDGRPSSGSLSDVIGDLGSENVSDDDEIPAEKTRIEENPLERLKEMEAQQAPAPRPVASPAATRKTAQAPVQQPLQSAQSQPTVALKNPPRTQTPATGQPRTNTPPTGAPRQAKMPPSGPLRLPDPPTAPGGRRDPANEATAGVAPLGAPMPPPLGQPRPAFPNFSQIPTMIADPEPPTAPGTSSQPPQVSSRPQPHSTAPPLGAGPNGNRAAQPTAPPGMSSYPVMSAEMSEQIARGADIFPSRPPGTPPPMAAAMPPVAAPMQPPMMAHNPYDPHAPHHPQMGGEAAAFMSPVGQHYPNQVNWAQAAAMPARALPKWVLVLLFVGAITAALILTIIIARIAR